MKFSAKTDNPLVSCTRGARRYIVAQILAPPSPDHAPRPSADISLVLDRSGSMAGRKFMLARKAVEQAIAQLSAKDTFSVVVYDDIIEVIQPATLATPSAKRQAALQLSEVGPRGCTNLGEGWLRGCGQIADKLTEERVGRCLLLTDGLANEGITSPEELCTHAKELRSRGVSTSTFGVGTDFDEVLLGQMADAGGGAFTFCETANQISGFIQRELGETLEIVARDVRIEVDAPLHIDVRPIGPYPSERTSDGVRIQLPDMVSEQDFELPFEVAVPGGAEGLEVDLKIRLIDRDSVFGQPETVVRWTLVDEPRLVAAPVQTDVQSVVAERLVALAKEEATAMNRDGLIEQALWRLEEERVRLTTAFVPTEDIANLHVGLRHAARKMRRRMHDVDRKRMHYSSSSLGRGGTDAGLSRKRRYHQ